MPVWYCSDIYFSILTDQDVCSVQEVEGVQCVEEERPHQEDHGVYQGPEREPLYRQPGQSKQNSVVVYLEH